MKNWRTTLAGSVLASPFLIQALLDAYTAGYFTDKTGLQLFASIGFIVLSVLVKDHNVTGGTNNKSIVDNTPPPPPPIIGGRPDER
jgi:hypothetical protein